MGIGSDIIRQFINKAQYYKKIIELKVLKNNPAKKFYLRFGFEYFNETEYEYILRYKNN